MLHNVGPTCGFLQLVLCNSSNRGATVQLDHWQMAAFDFTETVMCVATIRSRRCPLLIALVHHRSCLCAWPVAVCCWTRLTYFLGNLGTAIITVSAQPALGSSSYPVIPNRRSCVRGAIPPSDSCNSLFRGQPQCLSQHEVYIRSKPGGK